MAGDELYVLEVNAHDFGAARADKAVRGAVEAVAANLVLLVVLIGQREHICLGGHCRMEGVVENNDLRNILTKDLAAGTDALNVSAVVKGCKVAQALYAGDNVLINEHALLEQRTALDYAVTDGGNFGEVVNDLVGRSENLLDLEESRSVVFELNNVFELSSVKCASADSAVDSDTLADTFCYKLLAVHVDELIFKRGASGVDNKNFQEYCLQIKDLLANKLATDILYIL